MYVEFCKQRFGQFYNPALEKKLIREAKKNDESRIRETDFGIKCQLKQLEEKYTDVKRDRRVIYKPDERNGLSCLLKIDMYHLTSGLSCPESISD